MQNHFLPLSKIVVAKINLTEHFAIYPNASVAGEFFVHPESRYFSLEKIAKDQVADYAKRKEKMVDFIEKFLPVNINYR